MSCAAHLATPSLRATSYVLSPACRDQNFCCILLRRLPHPGRLRHTHLLSERSSMPHSRSSARLSASAPRMTRRLSVRVGNPRRHRPAHLRGESDIRQAPSSWLYNVVEFGFRENSRTTGVDSDERYSKCSSLQKLLSTKQIPRSSLPELHAFYKMSNETNWASAEMITTC
jgi:hypothetical protein